MIWDSKGYIYLVLILNLKIVNILLPYHSCISYYKATALYIVILWPFSLNILLPIFFKLAWKYFSHPRTACQLALSQQNSIHQAENLIHCNMKLSLLLFFFFISFFLFFQQRLSPRGLLEIYLVISVDVTCDREIFLWKALTGKV